MDGDVDDDDGDSVTDNDVNDNGDGATDNDINND